MPVGPITFLTISAGWLCMAAAPSHAAAPTQENLLDAYSIRQWTVEDGLPERVVHAVAEAADGYLWVATSRHVLRFDGFRFVDIGSPGADFDESPGEIIRQLVIDEHGTVSITTTTHLRRYGLQGWEPGTPVTEQLSVADEPDRCGLIDRSGAEWRGDEHGISELRDGRWATTENGKAPVNVSTNALAEDDEGNIWAGTDAGLVRLRRRTKGVRVIRANDRGPGVRAAWIAEDGTVWATAEQGGVIRAAAGAFETVRFSGENGGLRFESILVDHDGNVWLGTDGAALWHGRPGDQLDLISYATDGRRMAVIPVLAGDPARRLWIGSGAGLFFLDQGTTTPRPAPAPNTNVRVVEDILADSDGTFWIGRQDDWIAHLDGDGVLIRSFEDSGLPRGSIWAIHRDREGGLWAGGDGRVMRISDDPPTVFDVQNGLPDVAITQIEDTASGVLWLGTRDGLFACDLSRLESTNSAKPKVLFRRLDPDGPLAHVNCTGRINKAPPTQAGLAGGACFPTSIGLVMLDADAILTRPTPPLAIIESVTVNSPAGSQTTVAPRADIDVPADASAVTVRYTAIHLSAPEAVRFRYRVAPASLDPAAATTLDDWTTVGRDRRVILRSLPAGRRRFEVRAGIDGKYAEQSTAVTLGVETLFWQRPAFVVASGAAAAAAVAAASWGLLRRRYRRKLTRELALQRERERIARDIHDDLGAGLTHVAHLSAMAVEQGQDNDASRAMFRRIFSATNGLAQSLDEIVWAVNPANDSLDKLVSYLAEFAQEFT
ncbi:MAG: two-component regulator propeller domain-containing protein, partial [Pirellulales bacterium]